MPSYLKKIPKPWLRQELGGAGEEWETGNYQLLSNELLMWIWQAGLIPETYLKAIEFFIGQGREQI